MTELLERAMRAARDLPDDVQDEVARYIFDLTDQPPAIAIATPEEVASMAESLAEADRGEFATDEEVEAMWRKYGA